MSEKLQIIANQKLTDFNWRFRVGYQLTITTYPLLPTTMLWNWVRSLKTT